MATVLTAKELRNSQTDDLRRDLRVQQALVAKLRMGLKLQKEKDSAKYKREKKVLARMQTVLGEKRRGGEEERSEKKRGNEKKTQGLQKKAKSPKISTP